MNMGPHRNWDVIQGVFVKCFGTKIFLFHKQVLSSNLQVTPFLGSNRVVMRWTRWLQGQDYDHNAT